MNTATKLRSRLHRGVALTALVVAVGAAVPAFAQDTPTALDDVIVTAQKKSEKINDVPVSVTAVGGEKLDVIRSSGGDIRVLSSRIPSLTIESSFGRTFPRPYIRGLGNTDFDLNASQPVSFVYDDVVLENPILKGMPLFDIDQVEALRGPQGTLFGRNTPAGVLKFDSVKPGQTFGGYGSASYGTFGTANLEGAVGGPIVDGVLAGRISALYQHRDDWIDNDYTGKKNATGGYDEYALRGQLLYTPNEQFSALLNAHYMHLNGAPAIFRANIIKVGGGFVDGFDRGHIAQDGEPRSFQKVEASGAIANLAYDFGDAKLTSITAYEHVRTLSHGDVDGGYGASYAPASFGTPPYGPGFIPFSVETADGMPHHQQLSEEVRLSGDKDKLSYQVGAFYFNEDVKIDSYGYDAIFANGGQTSLSRQHQQTESWALFAHGDYKLTDQLTVSGGIRYSDDKKEYSQVSIQPASATVTIPDLKSNATTWDLNAVYAVTPNVNLYARVARGYRAPSIQGRSVGVITIANTETLMSYETGVKANAFDRKVRLDADVYYWRAKDLQLTAVGGTTNVNRLLNADKVTGYGFEFNGEFAPVANLLLTAGASFNHTEIQDPTLSTFPCGGSPTSTPICTVTDPYNAATGQASIDGNSLPNAPKYIANITARYAIPYRDGEFFIYTDWAYRSKINFFLYTSKEFQDDMMLEGGLRLGYSAHGGKWEAAVFGRNITNDRSLQGGIDFDNLTGFVNDPRTLGVEFKGRF